MTVDSSDLPLALTSTSLNSISRMHPWKPGDLAACTPGLIISPDGTPPMYHMPFRLMPYNLPRALPVIAVLLSTVSEPIRVSVS